MYDQGSSLLMTTQLSCRDVDAFWRIPVALLSSKQAMLRPVMSFIAAIGPTWSSSIFPCGMLVSEACR
jgi:hypothetical protein